MKSAETNQKWLEETTFLTANIFIKCWLQITDQEGFLNFTMHIRSSDG